MTASTLLLDLAAALDGIPIPDDGVLSVSFDSYQKTVDILLTQSSGPSVAAVACNLSKMVSEERTTDRFVYTQHRAPIKGAPHVTATWFTYLAFTPAT